jgi:hypothetical protein
MKRFIAGLVEDFESGKVDLRSAFRVSRQAATFAAFGLLTRNSPREHHDHNTP